MQIKEITNYLEQIAPLALQESYDNSGLLVGDPNFEVDSVLICLDITELVVEEAIGRGCSMIVSHHPIIFSGLKRLNPDTDAQRAILLAIKNDIALYSIHTNLDNVQEGVNAKIAQKLGIEKPRILSPKTGGLLKLVVFTPEGDSKEVANACFKAGGGSIGDYSECSFESTGKGSYTPGENSTPSIGEIGKHEIGDELKQEFLIPSHLSRSILNAIKNAHPYDEVAYDLIPLLNENSFIGSGMIGLLKEPMYTLDFLKHIKKEFGGVVRYTSLIKDQVQKIAWCGGSGSFLLSNAKRLGADLFLSSDFKYHQFFEAENQIIIADIGHYENEQFTIDLLSEKLCKKFPNFAFLKTETNTNPINYL